MIRTLAAAAVLLMATGASARQEGGTSYYFGHHEKFINVTFESNADVEDILGTTHAATGEAKVDTVKGTGSVSVTVPVGTLKTGIDMRDEHMRSPNWLDAAKFPDITFVSKKAVPVKDKKNQFEVTGDFTLHGVAKEKTVIVEWKEIPAEAVKKAGFPEGGWMRFSTSFEVKLSEHGVKVPDGVVAKVNDVWKVKIVLSGCTNKPEKK